MTRCMLLGVGTAVPDDDRGYTHLVWESSDATVLVDAGGNTFQRLLKVGVDPKDLEAIILTHSHPDHINGLPALLFSLHLAGRSTPVPIYGLGSTLNIAKRVVEAFELGEYVVPVFWNALRAGDIVVVGPSCHIKTGATEHSRPCIALRCEDKQTNTILTYSADTAPSQTVIELARDANLLVHEATANMPSPVHTMPRQVGEIASAAGGVQRLVLVHYSPYWSMPEARALDEVQAGGFMGLAEIGQEYQIIEL